MTPLLKVKEIKGIDWFGIVKENWAWAAPLIYIYVTIVGMLQAWFQFHAFGINVFEFSEINDFLMAAFREPNSFLAIVGIIVYFGIGILVAKIFEKIQKIQKIKDASKNILRATPSYRIIMNLTFFVVVIALPYFGPQFINEGYDDRWKEQFLSDPNRKVSAILKDLHKNGYKTGLIENLILIGTTNKYIFFFDELNRDIITVPLSNVLLIRRSESSNKAN
jgi:hypothetical protein